MAPNTEHPRQYVDSRLKGSGFDGTALLTLLLETLQNFHRNIHIAATGNDSPRTIMSEVNYYANTMGRHPTSALDLLSVSIRQRLLFDTHNAEVARKAGNTEMAGIMDINNAAAKVLVLIIQDVMNGAERQGLQSGMAFDEAMKRVKEQGGFPPLDPPPDAT